MRSDPDRLAELDAVGSAEAVAVGDVSPEELVEAAIERITRMNSQVNAVVTERFERAVEEARNSSRGRFRGVPIVAKDYRYEVEGEPTSYGMEALRANPFLMPASSHLATQLQGAGFVVVGRANTPEFATSVTTEPIAFGPTRNPWDTNRSVGGSSGGSAAAVAARMVPVGIGTDGGGSLRIPSSACGTVGLKPSRGRVSLGPCADEYWAGASVDGAITRTVRDAAALLDVMSGRFPGDPYRADRPAKSFEELVRADPPRLRIGVLTDPGDAGFEVHPSGQAALDHTVALLTSAGHRVSDDHPVDYLSQEMATNFGIIVGAEVMMLRRRLEELRGRPFTDEELEPRNALYCDNGAATSAVDYLRARTGLNDWRRRVARFWAADPSSPDGFDLLLTPTLNDLPPTIGEVPPRSTEANIALASRMTPFSSQANVLGFPAIGLPLHQDPAGLPVGVQLIANVDREDLLLQVANQLAESFVPLPRFDRGGGIANHHP